ncbi:hypothetical protein BIY23_03660 [Wolbachia pipientis]|uniref:YhdP central domain-containing protein n=1 Tax=Wolbachia pipientis TaxID=955 RepID=A0A1E7QJX7_WOLPI|nr:hypothetical protein BIY23_03660 [Wolbachia pipientis]
MWHKSNENSCFNITDLIIDNPNFTVRIPKLSIYFKLSSLLKTKTDLFHLLTNDVYIHIKDRQKTAITRQDLLKPIWQLFHNLDEKSRIEVNNIIINQDGENEYYIDKLDINKKEVLTICMYTNNKSRILKDLSITVENYNNLLNVYGTFDDLRLDKFVQDNKLIQDAGLQGNLSLKINKNNEILAGKVRILSVEQDVPTTLNNVNITFTYENNIIDIKNFHFKVNDIYTSVSGKMNINTDQGLLRVNISKFSVQDLCVYIPNNIINDELRAWYCNNVSGDILNMVINFDGNVRNHNSFTTVADIEDACIKFDADFEQVKNLNGALEFKNNNLKIIVNSAEFQDFTIDGEVKMDSLNKENAVLNIHGQAVSDAYALYATKLNKIIKVEKDKISGAAKSQFDFQILNLNVHGKKVDFLGDLHSKIDNLTVYNTDIGNYDLNLKFGKNFIAFNGVSEDEKVTFDFKKQNNNSIFKFNGNLPAQIIKNYINKNYIDIDGHVNLDIGSSINSDNTGVINGNIDLSKLIFNSSYLGWKGNMESLTFSAELHNDNKLLLEKLHIAGDNINISLSGKQENEHLYLSSNTFQLPGNDFNMTIELSRNQNTLTIYGNTINISDILSYIINNNDSISENNIKVSMYVDNVIMQENIIIRDAKLDLSCTHTDCSGSKFIGRFLQDDSNILAEYTDIGLEVYADNAGMFLRSLGISKSVKHGRISFYLSTQMENNKRYGMASISSFYVKDAPLLTKLLSMSSFVGIVNTLNNEGIYFDICNIPFSYSNNIVEIEKSSLTATELYITAHGAFNINNSRFQITGEIVPLYFINKLISNIPIFGKILTGGRSRGVIALDYKASGDDKNNTTSVNFITSATPNLFKRVLGIFDHIMTKVNKKYKKAH